MPGVKQNIGKEICFCPLITYEGLMFSYLSSYDSSPIILKICVLHVQLESTQNLYSEIW